MLGLRLTPVPIQAQPPRTRFALGVEPDPASDSLSLSQPSRGSDRSGTSVRGQPDRSLNPLPTTSVSRSSETFRKDPQSIRQRTWGRSFVQP